MDPCSLDTRTLCRHEGPVARQGITGNRTTKWPAVEVSVVASGQVPELYQQTLSNGVTREKNIFMNAVGAVGDGLEY